MCGFHLYTPDVVLYVVYFILHISRYTLITLYMDIFYENSMYFNVYAHVYVQHVHDVNLANFISKSNRIFGLIGLCISIHMARLDPLAIYIL